MLTSESREGRLGLDALAEHSLTLEGVCGAGAECRPFEWGAPHPGSDLFLRGGGVSALTALQTALEAAMERFGTLPEALLAHPDTIEQAWRDSCDPFLEAAPKQPGPMWVGGVPVEPTPRLAVGLVEVRMGFDAWRGEGRMVSPARGVVSEAVRSVTRGVHPGKLPKFSDYRPNRRYEPKARAESKHLEPEENPLGAPKPLLGDLTATEIQAFGDNPLDWPPELVATLPMNDQIHVRMLQDTVRVLNAEGR